MAAAKRARRGQVAARAPAAARVRRWRSELVYRGKKGKGVCACTALLQELCDVCVCVYMGRGREGRFDVGAKREKKKNGVGSAAHPGGSPAVLSLGCPARTSSVEKKDA